MSTHGPGGPTDTPPTAPAADHADAAAGRALVEFWGTRGSIPTPGSATQRYGGNSSCVALDFGGELFERTIVIIGLKQPIQRQHRRQQGRNPDHARR